MKTIQPGGLAPAFAAFLTWGLAPLFFRLLSGIPALEIVANRIVWAALLLAVVLALRGGLGILRKLVAEPRLAGLLVVTTALTTSNWLIFVWAINAGHVLESSLGYFISPLLSVLFGRLFLAERLRPAQLAAVALACCGVAWRVLHLGSLPWIALSLALTFSLYGLLRKRAPIAALEGLFIETLIALPVAAGWLLYQAHLGHSHFGPDAASMWLLASTGLITAIPLWLFTVGARRLPLSTLGFIQYVSPTMQFLLAVFAFGEAFNHVALIGFAFIWSGLAVYSADALRQART